MYQVACHVASHLYCLIFYMLVCIVYVNPTRWSCKYTLFSIIIIIIILYRRHHSSPLSLTSFLSSPCSNYQVSPFLFVPWLSRMSRGITHLRSRFRHCFICMCVDMCFGVQASLPAWRHHSSMPWISPFWHWNRHDIVSLP